MDLWFHFTVAVLATWRVTHLFQAEDGPFDLIFRLRKWAGPSFVGKLMDCFYCLSLWMALPLGIWLASSWTIFFIIWLALSGGAIVIHRLTIKRNPETAYYEEQ